MKRKNNMKNSKTLVEQKSSCICASSDDYKYDQASDINNWSTKSELKVETPSKYSLEALVDEYKKYKTPKKDEWEKLCKLKHTLKAIYNDNTLSYSGDKAILKKKLSTWEKNICVNIDNYKAGKVKCTKDQLDALTCKSGYVKSTYQNKKGKCYCYKSKGPVVVPVVDGCIDPKATNYYCKIHPSKCGADNDTLPEDADSDSLMVPTQCYYKVDETLEYTYILSSLDDPNPENSVNTWSGDIVISGSSSFDSPDDNSWLTKSYEPWRSYWREMCLDIKEANINFSTEKGLYVNQKDELILPDLVNALVKFTSDYGKAKFLKNYKIMVTNDNRDNLGVVTLYENKLTLRVRDTDNAGHGGLLSYRLKKNNGSQVSSSVAPKATSDNFNNYFRSSVKLINLTVSVDTDKNINVKELTNEVTIGLGTLLESKDKPIIGLGVLLNR